MWNPVFRNNPYLKYYYLKISSYIITLTCFTSSKVTYLLRVSTLRLVSFGACLWYIKIHVVQVFVLSMETLPPLTFSYSSPKTIDQLHETWSMGPHKVFNNINSFLDRWLRKEFSRLIRSVIHSGRIFLGFYGTWLKVVLWECTRI